MTKISDLPLLATGLASNTVPIEDALTTRKLTLSKVHQFCSAQGADVASAATVVLGTTDQEEEYFHVTGTVTITDIDFVGQQWSGRRAWVVFDGSLTLTHNATSLILPTGANIQTAAGDVACFVQDGGTVDNVRCIAYIRATGRALAPEPVASTTEVLTGTDTVKPVTADALAALWEKGSNVASAGTVSLGEGMLFHITGTTTITDIDFATPKDGRMAMIIFDGILLLTRNATTLETPGFNDITTAVGDAMLIVQDSGDNIRVLDYWRADGRAVNHPGANTTQAGIVQIAIQSEMEAGTVQTRAVCPAFQQFHPSAAKCFGFTTGAGTPALHANSYNVTSITDTAVGRLTVTIGTDFSSANWCGATGYTSSATNTNKMTGMLTKAAGSVIIECASAATTLADPTVGWEWILFGDQ